MNIAFKFTVDGIGAYSVIERATGKIVGKAMRTAGRNPLAKWQCTTSDGKVVYAAALFHICHMI
jgi:hypothetical protein